MVVWCVHQKATVHNIVRRVDAFPRKVDASEWHSNLCAVLESDTHELTVIGHVDEFAIGVDSKLRHAAVLPIDWKYDSNTGISIPVELVSRTRKG